MAEDPGQPAQPSAYGFRTPQRPTTQMYEQPPRRGPQTESRTNVSSFSQVSSRMSTAQLSPSTPQLFSSTDRWRVQRLGVASRDRSSATRQAPVGRGRPDIPGSQVRRVHAETPLQTMERPAVLYKMKRQRFKARWTFIRLVPKSQFEGMPKKKLTSKEAAFAYCKNCKARVNYSHGSTNAVKAHMEKFHMDHLVKAKEDAARESAAKRRLENAYSDAPGTKRRTLVPVTKEEQAKVNKLLASWIAQSLRPLTIVKDPGLIKFFEYVTQDLGGVSAALPGSTQLRADIGILASELRATLKSLIHSHCLYFCVTTDVWTSRRAQSFMALTIHYLEEDFTVSSWTLEVEPFPGRHTGVAIAKGLEKIMARWELRPENCVMLVRDGAANAVCASEILDMRSMSCIAHSLHLVVGGALLKQKKKAGADISTPQAQNSTADLDPGFASLPDASVARVATAEGISEENGPADTEAPEWLQDEALQEVDTFLSQALPTDSNTAMSALIEVRKTVQRFRDVAVYFHKSSKGTHRLDEIQKKRLKQKPLQVITDCPTRWNSCRDMLTRMIELEPALDHFFSRLLNDEGKKEFPDLSPEKRPKPSEWFTAKCLLVLLNPIAAVTTILEGENYPTLALTFPMLRRIKAKLSRPGIFDDAAALIGEQEYRDRVVEHMLKVRAAILQLFIARFSALDTDLLWITYLDPRFHKMKFLQSSEVRLAKRCLIDAAVTVAENQAEQQSTSSSGGPSVAPLRSPSDNTADVWDDVLGDDDCCDVDDVHDASSGFQLTRTRCKAEFEQYLEDAKSVERKQNPLKWWSVNHRKYPTLSPLARKWLGCVATSVPSERAFSTAGNTVTTKRSQLDPSLVRDLVFIAENQ